MLSSTKIPTSRHKMLRIGNANSHKIRESTQKLLQLRHENSFKKVHELLQEEIISEGQKLIDRPPAVAVPSLEASKKTTPPSDAFRKLAYWIEQCLQVVSAFSTTRLRESEEAGSVSPRDWEKVLRNLESSGKQVPDASLS